MPHLLGLYNLKQKTKPNKTPFGGRTHCSPVPSAFLAYPVPPCLYVGRTLPVLPGAAATLWIRVTHTFNPVPDTKQALTCLLIECRLAHCGDFSEPV